jgi:peptidoglycan/xylan/chitin deacetylase (PgdA/CDA1 family)
MTRFHIALIVSAILAAVSLVTGQFILLGVVVAALFIIIGLGVTFPQMSFFGPYLCRGDASRRCVALTFDDGPDSRSTPALLDVLGEQKIEAAFFCIGKKVAVEKELTARIAREGHLIGNHTFNHSYATNFFTTTRLKDELSLTQTAIQEATAKTPEYFRPPIGLSNPRTFRAATALGMKVIGWTVRSLDTKITEPERIVARIMCRVAPGAIILLHDGNIPAERLVMTVKLLLVKLKESGYEVVRLDRMLK